MHHLQSYLPRKIITLPALNDQGWRLKRYAILAEGRALREGVVSAAAVEALKRLPSAGSLSDDTGNHGVGFQLVHFAETAVVSPVFYWKWGSVLANIHQMKAQWDAPTEFRDGVQEIIGCVWEMDIVSFEVTAWKATLLSAEGTPEERLSTYLNTRLT